MEVTHECHGKNPAFFFFAQRDLLDSAVSSFDQWFIS